MENEEGDEKGRKGGDVDWSVRPETSGCAVKDWTNHRRIGEPVHNLYTTKHEFTSEIDL